MSILAQQPQVEPSLNSQGGLGRPFVVVTGGKGGVGKSTIAANLAALFGHVGARPLLVDLDFGLANLDVLLGVQPQHRLGAHVHGDASLRECLVEAPGGISLLPAGAAEEDAPAAMDEDARRRLLQGLREVAEPHGVIIGDSAAGVGPEVLSFAAEADRVLVVTTPEPAALTDAYGVVKALDHWARQRGLELPTPELFVNLVSSADEARRAVAGLTNACRRFLARSPRLVGWMPRGRAVLQATLARRPFVLDAPSAPATKQLARLAHRWVDGFLGEAFRSEKQLIPAPSGLEKGSQAPDGCDR